MLDADRGVGSNFWLGGKKLDCSGSTDLMIPRQAIPHTIGIHWVFL